MNEDDLEIHNVLPRYGTHGGQMCRKFASYQGDLVLLTEFRPSTVIDLYTLSDTINDINQSIEDDYIFDYCGTFICQDEYDYMEQENGKSVLRSCVHFPEGGLLSGLIFSDIKLGWSFRVQIAIHIARALCHLHNNNIVHNDVHTQALGFDSEWTCKLLDMFYVTRVDDIYSPQALEELKNDLVYAAPEVKLEGKCSAASDIFSFGLCLFEICSRVLVTSLYNGTEVFTDDTIHSLIDHLPDSVPESLRELIRQMLCLEVEYRPSIDDVLDWLECLHSETSLDDEPPLPPLPALPFPERRKSSRLRREESLSNMSSPAKSVASSDMSPAPLGGNSRGIGQYAISKSDAERLKNLARQQREKEGSETLNDSISSINVPQHEASSDTPSTESNIMIGVANDSDAPDLSGHLQLKADNLPFYKSKFFFFKDSNLVWCSDMKLRDQPERLHYFDLSIASIVDNTAPLGIHLRLDHSLSSEPLPGQSRKKLFRSSRVRDRLIIKFSNDRIAQEWKSVLTQEIVVDRCKMCRVKLITPEDRRSSEMYEGKEFFCSAVCVNYYIATTARGMVLSGKSLEYSNSLRLSQTDMKALDKQVIARRNPKTWKRILRKQGSDLSNGIEKEAVAEATPLPQSVEEWLNSISLGSLIDIFLESGYDCIGHIIIASLYEDDMNFMKIQDKKTRLILMSQSKLLGQTYVKNSKIARVREEQVVA